MPKSNVELKVEINLAWDAYIAKLKLLMENLGLELHGIASAHKTIGQEADDAYKAFLSEQDRLQLEWGRYVDAPYLAREARAGYDRALKNAQAKIDAAQFQLDQIQEHIDKVERGDFAEYGITKPTERALDELAQRTDEKVQRLAERESIGEEAAKKLFATFASLEAIKPGVTAKYLVDAELPSSNDNPVERAEDATKIARDNLIREAIGTYHGKLTKNGVPRLRALRTYAGLSDITKAERDRLA